MGIVKLSGKVDYAEIPKLLLECDTFVMNGTYSKFSETAYPVKHGEYFACNRHVLISYGPRFSEDFAHLQ